MFETLNEKISKILFNKVIIIVLILVSIPAVYAQSYPDYGVKVETVAENLLIPWSIVWTPEGTIFFTERIGTVRAIENGNLTEPILTLDVADVEGGMLGIALDPNYSENHYIYLYYTYENFLTKYNNVVRFVENNLTLTQDKVIIDKIPGGPYHDGGRIKFGPDDKLYITTGDAGNADLAQDIESLGGKILRINSDGTIPEDNPFEDSPVFSYGHRNPQGIDWDTEGNLISTEHGPSGWRGVAHDEINLIIPGANYGWPEIIGSESANGLEVPIHQTGEDTWAPSGATFYIGDKIPEWNGKYFVATLRGNHLHMIDIKDGIVQSHEKLFSGEFGRLRDVSTGPDGYLYVLTSNKDGRGTPQINDDRILRIVPLQNIQSFEDCIDAGNPVMESYPRQCRTTQGEHFIEDISKIPEWVRNIFVWYGQGQVSDDELINAIEFLINQGVIKIR